MADGLQSLATNAVLTSTVFNKVARRVVIDGNTAAMFALSALEGEVFWNTDLNALYAYDGSNWTMVGGRQIGIQMVQSTSAQSIPDGGSTLTTVLYDTAPIDTDGFNNGSGEAKIPAGFDGTYSISANVTYGGVVGPGYVNVNWNGDEYYDSVVGTAIGGSTSAILPLVAGDIIKINVTQSSGGALNISAAHFFMFRVGP